MSRVLVPAEASWYEELRAVGYYGESDFERDIRQHVKSLFPDFYVFPFKAAVSSQVTGQTNKPDLAMVRHDVRAWGVIEVELASHRIGHVLDQTRSFATGNYNAPEIAKYIKAKLETHCRKKISLSRLQTLIQTEAPTVLVIADEQKADWKSVLCKEGIDLCMFQIFKNSRGQFVYRTQGDYPIVPTREAHCRRHAILDNVVEIVGNFQFRRLRQNRLDVAYETFLTKWQLFADGGKHYLRFLGSVNPLSPNQTYVLFSDSRDRYYFKIN